MCHNECYIIAIQVVIYFLNYYNFFPECSLFVFFPFSRLSITQENIQILGRKISLSLLFLLSTGMCVISQSCPTRCRPHGLWSSRLLCPWDFSGKNAGVGCHFLLQKIFLTQALNLHLLSLLHCRWIFLPPVPRGKPYNYIFLCCLNFLLSGFYLLPVFFLRKRYLN